MMTTAPLDPDSETSVDGRRARRDRNRLAVIDALFGLLVDGALPSTDAIAARAGVSVSSIYRYFDSLDDLQQQTIDVHLERNGALFTIDEIGTGDRTQRIEHFVGSRLRLHEAVAPVGRLARARAFEHRLVAAQLQVMRRLLVTETRRHFAGELDRVTPATADDAVTLIDTQTSFEAWQLLTDTHARSGRQIRRSWILAVTAILAAVERPT